MSRRCPRGSGGDGKEEGVERGQRHYRRMVHFVSGSLQQEEGVRMGTIAGSPGPQGSHISTGPIYVRSRVLRPAISLVTRPQAF